jgi:hypothetical protein
MPAIIAPRPLNLSTYALKTDIQQNFVTSAIITQSQMWATYPPSITYRGRYCRVSDMWGLVDGVYRCTFNGRIYYWEPTNQNQLVGAITPTGNMTIQPMVTSPIIELVGAGPATLTTWGITIGTDNIVPGLVKEVRGSFSSLLGSINILGVGSTLNLALGGSRRIASFDNGTSVVWRQLT